MKLHIYSLIMFLNSYLTGLLTPVLSLALIDKGASLSNLSIILGLYALSVILLEVPSGVVADVFGRKRTFILSLTTFTVSFLLLLTNKGFIVLCIVMILYGFGRALGSGSFDALFIDYYIDNFGKDKLHNISTRLSVLDALGLSAGALSGGFFPDIADRFLNDPGPYDLNIIVRILLTLALIFISLFFVTEKKTEVENEHPSIKQHVKNSSAFIYKNTTIIFLFISVFSTGFFLSALETYWQPHFITLLPQAGSTGLLGLMAFLYLGAAMLGSLLSHKTISKFKFSLRKMYLALRAFIAFFLIMTALQKNIPLFIAFYSSIYFMFGMATIPEDVILNSETPNEIRASVLSVKSFTIQIGGLTGSLMYSILIKFLTIPSIWILAACIVLLTLLIIAKKFIADK
ncbi:MAG TPA: MFS transporter [Sedimentibacter sp.]|nr:MFS transporter [Sedimentibacter sp.]HOW22026.1 MFS transporter [Sedimentibacter sp.]HRC79959.1 MFS transporter [Sedimentibacter sp.]